MKRKPKSSIPGLSALEERFCEEYLVDLNGSEAAARAGYSKRSRQQMAHVIMKKPAVIQRIIELKAKASERLEISADKVLMEIASIGFANIRDFIGDDNTITSLKDLPPLTTKAVSSIEVTEKITPGPDGKKPIKEVTTKLKLHPKVAALDQLAKHLGLFEKDNKQKSGIKIKVTSKPASNGG